MAVPDSAQKPDDELRPPCSSPTVEKQSNLSSEKASPTSVPRSEDVSNTEQNTTSNEQGMASASSQRRVRFAETPQIQSNEETNQVPQPGSELPETALPDLNNDSLDDWVYSDGTDEFDVLDSPSTGIRRLGRAAELGMFMQRQSGRRNLSYNALLALYGKQPKKKPAYPCQLDCPESPRKPLYQIVNALPSVPIASRTRFAKKSPRSLSATQTGIVTFTPNPKPPSAPVRDGSSGVNARVLLTKRTLMLTRGADKVRERVEYQSVEQRATSASSRPRSAPDNQLQGKQPLKNSAIRAHSAKEDNKSLGKSGKVVVKLELNKAGASRAGNNSELSESLGETSEDEISEISDTENEGIARKTKTKKKVRLQVPEPGSGILARANTPVGSTDSLRATPINAITDHLMSDDLRREHIVSSLVDKFLHQLNEGEGFAQYARSSPSPYAYRGGKPAISPKSPRRFARVPSARKMATAQEMAQFRRTGKTPSANKNNNKDPGVITANEEAFLSTDSELGSDDGRRLNRIDINAYDFKNIQCGSSTGRPMIGSALVLTKEEEAMNGTLHGHPWKPKPLSGEATTPRSLTSYSFYERSNSSNPNTRPTSCYCIGNKPVSPRNKFAKMQNFAETSDSSDSSFSSDEESPTPRLHGLNAQLVAERKRLKQNMQLKDFEVLAEEYLQYCLEVKQRLERRGIIVSIHTLLKSLCPPLVDASLPAITEAKTPAAMLTWKVLPSDARAGTGTGSRMQNARIAAAQLLEKNKKGQMATPFQRNRINSRDMWMHLLALATKKETKKPPADQAPLLPQPQISSANTPY